MFFRKNTECLVTEGYSFAAKEQIRVLKLIAEGGMGAVYKAVYQGLEGFEKVVALKFLKPVNSSDERVTKYFINEGKLVARLVHENIVQLSSLGKHKGCYYIVYEYISGTTLYEFLTVHRLFQNPIPQELSVYIVSRIARGLAYAHSSLDDLGNPCNIVHRDICPRNIMLSTEGQPKLTDFGIAMAQGRDFNESFAGKPLYMSPEQAMNDKMDFRSDIYSLGLVLFSLLTGEPARETRKGDEYLLYQARQGIIEWRLLKLDEDSELYGILRKMLAPNPADRYQETSSLFKDLEMSIYSKGYGPTASDLAEYLHQHLPHIFKNTDRHGQPDVHDHTRDYSNSDHCDKTTCELDDDFLTDSAPTVVI